MKGEHGNKSELQCNKITYETKYGFMKVMFERK